MNVWDEICVSQLGEIVAGGTPDRSNPSYWNGSIPWITPGEITEMEGKYVRSTRECVTAEGLAESATRLLPEGSVLVTTRATLGETAIAGVPLATNQGFKNVIPNGKTDSLFAYYLLGTLKPALMSDLLTGRVRVPESVGDRFTAE
jgi:type I restriction enzyme S subunit